MNKLAVKDIVWGEIRARGPVTLDKLVKTAFYQVEAIENKYEAQLQVVYAINDLAREVKIELYDTGDAWDVKCNWENDDAMAPMREKERRELVRWYKAERGRAN